MTTATEVLAAVQRCATCDDVIPPEIVERLVGMAPLDHHGPYEFRCAACLRPAPPAHDTDPSTLTAMAHKES